MKPLVPFEALAVFAAIIAIPFYLGLIHLPVGQLLIYSVAASAAMTTGEFIEAPKRRAGGMSVFLLDCLLWFAVITLLGGVTYAVALIF